MSTARTVSELAAKAESLVASLIPRTSSATLVTLSGVLGAGKTTFAQAVAKALGVEETVTSPTFVLEKIYQLEGQRWRRLVHLDAYRLKSAHELEMLGWRELLADSGNLILLEWPERVPQAIPAGAIRISFDIQGDERIISIDGEKSGTK